MRKLMVKLRGPPDTLCTVHSQKTKTLRVHMFYRDLNVSLIKSVVNDAEIRCLTLPRYLQSRHSTAPIACDMTYRRTFSPACSGLEHG